MSLENYNPNEVSQRNGNFIGLPFSEESADLILFPIPFDATVSYRSGTHLGPANIREGSLQLDLYDARNSEGYQRGIFMPNEEQKYADLNQELRPKVEEVIDHLEAGKPLNSSIQKLIDQVNQGSQQMIDWVAQDTRALLEKGKLVGLLGGDHSTPLGYLKALGEIHQETGYGILQIDAHMDLRKAYEGFTYSHASIFYNALEEIPAIKKLVQFGIRDYCEEELDYQKSSKGRVKTYFNEACKKTILEGTPFGKIAREVVEHLPEKVYVSFDIDGLEPSLCPNTGTPVPGGLSFDEAVYLIHLLGESGRKIIGFDLSEVGGNEEWDGNVGSRIAYKLALEILATNSTTKTQ